MFGVFNQVNWFGEVSVVICQNKILPCPCGMSPMIGHVYVLVVKENQSGEVLVVVSKSYSYLVDVGQSAYHREEETRFKDVTSWGKNYL